MKKILYAISIVLSLKTRNQKKNKIFKNFNKINYIEKHPERTIYLVIDYNKMSDSRGLFIIVQGPIWGISMKKY